MTVTASPEPASKERIRDLTIELAAIDGVTGFEQPVVRRIFREIDPANRSAGRRGDTQGDDRIRIACPRIVPVLNDLIVRQVVDDDERRHQGVVDPEKRNARRVRTPPGS